MPGRRAGFFSVIALIAAFGLPLAAPRFAVAAPGGGAEVSGGGVDLHNCFDEDGISGCNDAVGEWRKVTTPAGGINIQLNFRRNCVTLIDDLTGDELVAQCEFNQHQQTHFDQAGGLHLVTIHQTGWNRQQGVACDVATILHEVDGVVQYDRSVISCG
jgi:hypothetical protein